MLNTPGAVGSGEKGGGNGGDGCEASELCAETSRYNAMERRPRLWETELGMFCSDDVSLRCVCRALQQLQTAVLRGEISRDNLKRPALLQRTSLNSLNFRVFSAVREGRGDSDLLHTNIPSHGLRGGKEATRAWSGVVGLGVDRLEVRARRLRRGKGVV